MNYYFWLLIIYLPSVFPISMEFIFGKETQARLKFELEQNIGHWHEPSQDPLTPFSPP